MNFFRKIEIWIAALAVFFVPFNFIRTSFAYFTLADGLFILSLLIRLIVGTFPLNPIGRGTSLWLAGMALLWSGLLTSSIFQGDLIRGMIVTGQYAFTLLVIPAVIMQRPWRQTVLLVRIFCLSTFVMCVHGVYVIDVAGERYTRFVSGSGRLQGFVERENECGALIALAFPLLLWLVDTHRIRWWAAVPVVVAYLYGTMLTGSNTGMFTLVIGTVIYVLIAFDLRRVLMSGAIVAILGGGLLTLGQDYLPRVFRERVLVAFEAGDLEKAGTFEGRMALISESVEIARHTMLIGLGADSFQEVSAQGAPVHNTYMLVWTEGGLLALAGLVLVLISGLVPAMDASMIPRGRQSAAVAICSIIAFGLLINAAPHIYGRFWFTPLLLAISCATTLLEHGPPPKGALVRARLADAA